MVLFKNTKILPLLHCNCCSVFTAKIFSIPGSLLSCLQHLPSCTSLLPSSNFIPKYILGQHWRKEGALYNFSTLFTVIFSAPLDMLIQWSNESQELTWELFFRFLPLKFVDISVHSAKDRRLKLKLVSGRSYYLELCAPPQKRSLIFHQWLRLINLLKSTQSEVNFLPKDFDVRAKYRNRPSKMTADQVNTTPLHKSGLF